MVVMSKKKPVHLDPKETFHLPPPLQVALEVAALSGDLPATKTDVLRTALLDYLKANGLWPCPEAKVRKMLQRKPLARLSPQARKWLRENGFAG